MNLYLLFLLLLSFSLAVTLLLIGYAMRFRHIAGAAPFILMLASESLWMGGYIAELLAPTLAGKRFWDNLEFTGLDGVTAGIFLFALVYTHRGAFARRVAPLLCIQPLANIALVWTDPLHHLVRGAVEVDQSSVLPLLVYSYGPWMWLSIVYTYVLLAAALAVLVAALLQAQPFYRRQLLVVSIGPMVPMVGSLLTATHAVPIAGMESLDITPITLAIMNPLIGWGIFRYRLLELAPVARHQVVEQMADGVLVLDMRYRIIDLNPAMGQILGAPPERLIGQPVQQVLAEWRDLIGRYRNVLAAHDEIAVQYRGEEYYLDLQISPLIGPHGKPNGRLVVWRDITERKRAELALLQQKQQLEAQTAALRQAKDDADAASRAKGQFLSTMTHELRTPLTAILGYTELIEAELHSGEYDQVAGDIEHVKTSGAHLLNLINRVLEYSKIEAGKLALEPDTLDIAGLVAEVVAVTRPLVEQRANTFSVQVQPQIGVVYADALRVRQVVLNLLSNAAKFTQDGTVGLRVSREPGPAGAAGELVVFEVADTGIGMSAEEVSQLFQEFTQVSAMSRRKGGTGLGLAVSRKLCQLMGGDITVTSQPGAGAVFRAYIPALMPPALEQRGER